MDRDIKILEVVTVCNDDVGGTFTALLHKHNFFLNFMDNEFLEKEKSLKISFRFY